MTPMIHVMFQNEDESEPLGDAGLVAALGWDAGNGELGAMAVDGHSVVIAKQIDGLWFPLGLNPPKGFQVVTAMPVLVDATGKIIRRGG